jgi:hypothetical protein
LVGCPAGGVRLGRRWTGGSSQRPAHRCKHLLCGWSEPLFASPPPLNSLLLSPAPWSRSPSSRLRPQVACTRRAPDCDAEEGISSGAQLVRPHFRRTRALLSLSLSLSLSPRDFYPLFGCSCAVRAVFNLVSAVTSLIGSKWCLDYGEFRVILVPSRDLLGSVF